MKKIRKPSLDAQKQWRKDVRAQAIREANESAERRVADRAAGIKSSNSTATAMILAALAAM